MGKTTRPDSRAQALWGNLKAAQKLLGHADISTTARFYAHVDMDDLRELLEQDGRTDRQGNRQGSTGQCRKASK